MEKLRGSLLPSQESPATFPSSLPIDRRVCLGRMGGLGGTETGELCL